MKKIFYIHPGIHKTGSTAIQNALENNQSVLNQLGFASLVPHNEFVRMHQLFNPKAYGLSTEPDIKSIKADFAARLERIAQNKIILSEEDFTPLSWPWRRHAILLRSLLEDFAEEIHLVFYVRRQDKLFESAYLQRLEGGDFKGSIDELISNEHTSPLNGNLDWQTKISEFKAVIQPDSLKISIYDFLKVQNIDIFYDFCSQLGIENMDQLEPSKRVNPSRAAWISRARYGWLGRLPPQIIEPLLHRLNAVVSFSQHSANCSILDKTQAQQILRFYADSNRRLIEQYAPEAFEILRDDWHL